MCLLGHRRRRTLRALAETLVPRCAPDLGDRIEAHLRAEGLSVRASFALALDALDVASLVTGPDRARYAARAPSGRAELLLGIERRGGPLHAALRLVAYHTYLVHYDDAGAPGAPP